VRGTRLVQRRALAAVGAVSLLLTACPAPDEPEVAPDDPDVADPADLPADAEFVLETGIFQDITTDSVWTAYGPELSVWNAYLLGPTTCTLYTREPPTYAIAPDLAAHDWQPAEQQDDGTWAVEVQIREDASWSDDEPVTAGDFVFTFEVVREFGLGGNWLSYWHPPNPEDPGATAVTAVAAVDHKTVRIVFNNQPGLAFWPHDVGSDAIVQPEHFWSDVVEQAREAAEPEAALMEASGAGAPSCGPVTFDELEPGAFASTVANETWWRTGEQQTHYEDGSVEIEGELFGGAGEGEVVAEHEIGPFLGRQVYTLYGAQDAAVLALRRGEVDFLYNPIGLERGLMDPLLDDPDLQVVSNPAYGIRYMAYNFRKAPTNDRAFRQALTTMIDREFMAENVLGGVAFPLFGMMPPGNAAGWEAALFDHYQAMVTAICTKLRLGRTQSMSGEWIGGSTYSYDVWEGHPVREEVLRFLQDTRERAVALRRRVETHNLRHSAPEEAIERVIAYVGQTVVRAENAEEDDE
jgi:peptide/nickel transport system substrate-binding protein